MVDDAGAACSSSSMASIHAWQSNVSMDDPARAQLVLFGGQAPVGSWWA
jgi:hypothetical protein